MFLPFLTVKMPKISRSLVENRSIDKSPQEKTVGRNTEVEYSGSKIKTAGVKGPTLAKLEKVAALNGMIIF